MSKISPIARAEIVLAMAERYRGGTRTAKRRILDEFVALTGYHRKHAIRVLNRPRPVPRGKGTGQRTYDEAVKQAVIVLWEASDRICGKRLKALLPILIESLERHGHLELDPAVRVKLLAVSAATLDRLLSGAREATRGKRKTRPKRGVRGEVPVRSFGDWKDPPPGFMEVDLVAHGGESVAGSFAYTLVLTDIASGWTECTPLAVREASVVV